MSTPFTLILPGWRQRGSDGWLSPWDTAIDAQHLDQDDWEWPRRGDWLAQLDAAVADSSRPVCLVGVELGARLIAAWASQGRHAHRACAALLIEPPDLCAPDLPPQWRRWRTIDAMEPLRPLPWPAAVVCQPAHDAPHLHTLATAWGAHRLHRQPGVCGPQDLQALLLAPHVLRAEPIMSPTAC